VYRLPKPPKFTLAALGPGLVLIALGLGSGEYILWPNLVAQYGFGILWGAVVGVTLQYFINTEGLRYTIATGGSVYAGWYKLNKWIPYWFIISTYASFMWPGIIGSAGVILSYLFGIEDARWFTIGLLIIIGLLLSFGGRVYDTLERFQKLVIFISIPALVIIATLLFDPIAMPELLAGLIGKGNGYWFFPTGISISAFLGAIAYAGAGGNLVISSNFYAQDKGYGNSQHVDTQINRVNKSKVHHTGVDFLHDTENVHLFKRWFSFATLEQLLTFWLIGVLSIVILGYIAFALLYPSAAQSGLGFLFTQAGLLAARFGQIVGTAFLAIGALFLFKTQLGIYETTSRIITENLQLLSHQVRNRFARSSIFFTCLWLQIITAIGITLLGIQEPIQILLIGTFFSAVSTFALSPLLLWLNNSHLLISPIRPGWFRNSVLIVTGVFFGVFVLVTILVR
jgi:hypothetical protein